MKFRNVFASSLLKVGTGGWQAQNSYNFLKSNLKEHQTYKVIIQDVNDEIIDLNASLMAGVSRELCNIHSRLKQQSRPKEPANLPGILAPKQAK